MNIAVVQPGQCFVCRFAEQGIGFAPPPVKGRKRAAITWVCDDDLPFARTVHHMKKDILNRIEKDAVAGAMQGVGDYLDRIGKTDLATLTRDEFETIGEVFLEHFGNQMRERLGAGQPPF